MSFAERDSCEHPLDAGSANETQSSKIPIARYAPKGSAGRLTCAHQPLTRKDHERQAEGANQGALP